MAAPRATQFIALRNLARGGQQVRQLHMTGPATYASPVLPRESSPLNLPRDVVGLRAECKRRNINASGSKSDLITRLHADEISNTRAFSTAAHKRPTPAQETSTPITRHINTSRALRSVNDSSTIDFFYFPNVDETSAAASDLQVRVPIIPTLSASASSQARHFGTVAEEYDAPVMKPQISTMSADAIYLPMAELSDGHAMNIDFHALADRVASNLRRMSVPVEERAGLVKQIWNDMVDDLMGGLDKRQAGLATA